jgi:ketosteroid isomerase-like protein
MRIGDRRRAVDNAWRERTRAGDTSLVSSQNLDLVRSIHAAWEQGDFSSTAWADPEIELVFADGPDPGTWKGLGEVVEGWRNFLSIWQDWHVEVEEYREIDDEQVLVPLRLWGRGKTSGLDMSARAANVYTLRSGMLVKIVLYWDRNRALADLGLTRSS